MLFETHAAIILAAALVVDAMLGDPDWLWRRAPHPVVMTGRLIAWLDRALNHGAARRLAGVAALGVLIAAAGSAGLALHWLFALHPIGMAGEVVAVAVLLAQRSLYDHVARVHRAFAEGGLPGARAAVSLIVGRDPDALDESGVCRAAIETLAENFSDGVVAPALWYLVAGLPGIAIYKAVNTADSMIGHRTPRHLAFGWASARLDDLMNLVPARVSGVLTVIAALLTGGDAGGAWRAMRRDAGRHRSPNAGWPEAAMAGALGVAIAGPRAYASGWVEDGWMNEGGRIALRPEDILRALRVFVVACGLLLAMVLGIALSLG